MYPTESSGLVDKHADAAVTLGKVRPRRRGSCKIAQVDQVQVGRPGPGRRRARSRSSAGSGR